MQSALPLSYKPHIVHVLADDLGWADVGWHREAKDQADVKTPSLDALAASGVRLERFYTHQICSPSRSAIQSGRAPIHVNVQNVLPEVVNPADPIGGYQGIPTNMTGIASVLRGAGYRTRFVGKWDVGMATPMHHPRARGYESWLGYWHHANDYWQQTTGSCGAGTSPRDLWRFDTSTDADGPAVELANGPRCSQHNQSPADETCAFEDAILTDEVVRLISTHNASEPLFLFWAPHLIHMPLQAPRAFVEAFAFIDDERRRLSHAMASLLDHEVARVVAALHERSSPSGLMWDSTLLVFHSDNGGEILFAGLCGGNNWPLTGGKFSNFEGGIRVNAFVTGGAIPAAARNASLDALITAWDWYATFAALAGADPTDNAAAAAGLPPIDSLNMWPLLSGENASAPRTEVVIGETGALTKNGDGQALVGGLIDAEGYKLVLGPEEKLHKVSQYVQTGPSWPNSSSHLVPDVHPKVLRAKPAYPNPPLADRLGSLRAQICGRSASTGCLFNVFTDPTERINLAASLTQKFYAMLARVDTHQATVYSPVRGQDDPRACEAVSKQYGGYWGPFVE